MMMTGIILISHGPLAEGMLESSRLFFGDSLGAVEAVTLKGDDPDEVEQLLLQAVRNVDEGDGIIILCDLLGGTPCNVSARIMNEKTRIITGMNFPMLLDLLGKRLVYNDISQLDLDGIIARSKEGITDLQQFLNSRQPAENNDW